MAKADMARRPLIAGNWKMNGLGSSRGEGRAGFDGLALADALKAKLATGPAPRCDVAIFPPATLIARISERLAGSVLALGGQDCHPEASGAHTGDVSAEMLKEAGCRYVILGHSERRAGHGESDAQVRAKAVAAKRAGLIAIVCVGETESERRAGQAETTVGRQIAASLPEGVRAADIAIAYEPVWAIGSSRTPTGDEIAALHGFIRNSLQGRVKDAADLRILYGGSVKPENAASLLKIANVDGALVGGASLKAEEFWAIVQSSP
jgi:triosephosphate isomerase (TIM)